VESTSLASSGVVDSTRLVGWSIVLAEWPLACMHVDFRGCIDVQAVCPSVGGHCLSLRFF
jgi:hypothetical protein